MFVRGRRVCQEEGNRVAERGRWENKMLHTGILMPKWRYMPTYFFFILLSGGWGKKKALAHDTSTYFHTRRVSI